VVKKVISVFQKNTTNRIIQAFNKSPMRFLTKTLSICKSPHVYLKRKSLAKSVILTPQEQEVVNSLNQYGYAEMTSLLSPEKVKALSDYCLDKMKRSEEIKAREILKTKDFWTVLSDEDIADKNLTADNPLVNFALQVQVLRIVSAYLKQVPFIEYVMLTLSKYTGEPLKSSQLWHLDYDNTSMVKLFVYLTDVTSVEPGPFTFIDAVTSKNIKNSFITRHLPDNEVFSYVEKNSVRQMTKPKLSCFMVDTTRCYHMGSRLQEGHHRLMYTALYTGLPPIYYWSGREKYQPTPNLEELQLWALKVKPN